MAITDYRFEDGIFFAREHGQVSEEEAAAWRQTLERYAASSPTPIAAVVDALGVTYVVNAAREIFAQASFTENLLCVAVASQALTATTANVIGLMGKRGQTHVFPTLDAAYDFVRASLEAERTLHG